MDIINQMMQYEYPIYYYTNTINNGFHNIFYRNIGEIKIGPYVTKVVSVYIYNF